MSDRDGGSSVGEDRNHGPDAWARVVAPLDLDPGAAVCIALSGGADSVHLLRVAAAARERPRVVGAHVEHALRGEESAADARACAELCAELGVEHAAARAPVDRARSGLEARARAARYAALAEIARARGIATIATAHHADDALETLVLRWVRGADFAGLGALRPRLALAGTPEVVVVRPLLGVRRAEIRAALERAGATWREDSSNEDVRFARNAVRHELLPAVAAACGPRAIDDLHAFARALAALERALGACVPALRLEPPAGTSALATHRRGPSGGGFARGAIAALDEPYARRALARLLAETTGDVPRRAELDALLADATAGRPTRRALRGGWTARVRRERVELEPPTPPRAATAVEIALPVPGVADLGDGRRIEAELREVAPDDPLPRDPACVDVDARGLRELRVRAPRPGDRFHALGAPGSKPLARFLADVGIAAGDRALVRLVASGDEIVWVAGVRPAEARRVRADTGPRVRLTLGTT